MRFAAFQHVAPESLDAALRFLSDHARETKVIAGGTDLVPSMKQGLFKPKYLMSLDGVEGLSGIEFDEEKGLSVGPLVKLRALETNRPIADRYPVIRQAATAVAAPQLRAMGTVGGNLILDTRCCYYNQSDFWRSCRPTCIKMGGETCNAVGGGKKCFAAFRGDLAPALVALGATVKVASPQGERTVSLCDLYTGDGAKPFRMEPEELLVEIRVPAPQKNSWAAYFKYRNRRSIDFPLASVAARFVLDPSGTMCRGATVVIGGVSSSPMEVTGVAGLIEGKGFDPRLAAEASELAAREARPVENVLGSSRAQRRRMIQAFVLKAVEQGLTAHESQSRTADEETR